MKSRTVFILLAVIGLLSGGAVSQRYLASAQGRVFDRAGGHDAAIEVLLETGDSPAAGQTARFTLTATPYLEARQLAISWQLSEGLELVEGKLNEATEPVAGDGEAQRSITIRVLEPGTHRIAASATYQPHPAAIYGAAGVLFITSDAAGATVSDRDPRVENPNNKIIPGWEAQVTPATDAAESPSATDVCFTINATATRENRKAEQYKEPFTEEIRYRYVEETVPIRHARVGIYEDDPFFDDYLGSEVLDENGRFNWSHCVNDGWFDDVVEIYLKLYTIADGDYEDPIAIVYDSEPIFGNLYVPYVYKTGTKHAIKNTTLNFNMPLENDNEMSASMNILEAAYDGWDFWNRSGGASGRRSTKRVDIHWTPGKEARTSYSPAQDTIFINGDASHEDEWDDSSIIHEYAHFTDDQFGCAGNPGGEHDAATELSPELAFGEGYPQYYQSAVRKDRNYPYSSVKININGMNECSVCNDLETWNDDHEDRRSDRYEYAVAATFWDLTDSTMDSQDIVTFDHALVQSIYTSDTYAGSNWRCNFRNYFLAWALEGNPATAEVAAVVTQNTEIEDIFDLGGSSAASGERLTAAAFEADSFPWWGRLALVLDNSQSMSGQKLSAAKTVLKTHISRITAMEGGMEIALDLFNNRRKTLQPVFNGQFFAGNINPVVDSVTTASGTDNNCSVRALQALEQAIDGREDSDIWLITDGPTSGGESRVADISQRLAAQNMRASFINIGLCQNTLLSAAEEADLARQGSAWGADVGLAVVDPPNSIIPYLRVALNSGGQYMFVDAGQLHLAAEILEAQIVHNAGAGRWSDYVSDRQTYRWDKLASWEYDWINARKHGVFRGKPGNRTSEDYENVPMPSLSDIFTRRFDLYGFPTHTAHVYENGYITFNGWHGEAAKNTGLPDEGVPNFAVYPYWDDLEWDVPIVKNAPQAVGADDNGAIYSHLQGNWFAIEYYGFHLKNAPVKYGENFQVQFNLFNDELRFLYKKLENNTQDVTIGVEYWQSAGQNDGVQVSFNKPNPVAAGEGFKLVPAPPQPSRTYTTVVDSTMESVAFLLTGFSGSFDKLEIRLPDGKGVKCADAGVLCLEVGLVQYVQVDVNGRFGEWEAEVSAGPTGSGTFNFSTMAVSPLVADNLGGHDLPLNENTPLYYDLGLAVDGNVVSGRFRRPNDRNWGQVFSLFDDGNHGDGAAGDGVFASDPRTPPGAGMAFLVLSGEVGGQAFQRVDPVPYFFRKLSITTPNNVVDHGSGVELEAEIRNLDSFNHCYRYSTHIPAGWSETSVSQEKICVAAGAAKNIKLSLKQVSDLPSGTYGLFSITLVEDERGAIYDTAMTEVSSRREPAGVSLFAAALNVPPDSDPLALSVTVTDEQQRAVADGTQVQLSTTEGLVLTPAPTTIDGLAQTEFAPGTSPGTAVITAETANGIKDSIEITIAEPSGQQLAVKAADQALPADGESTTAVTVTVTDFAGEPVSGMWVRLSAGSEQGTIDGEEGILRQSDVRGEVKAIYTSGSIGGDLMLLAELLSAEDGEIVAYDLAQIKLQELIRSYYFPIIR